MLKFGGKESVTMSEPRRCSGLRRRVRFRPAVAAGWHIGCAVVIAVIGYPGTAALGDPIYVDVTTSAGITHVSNWSGEVDHIRSHGYGSGVGDYDGDGYADIYLCTGWGFPNELYHNNGDGTFSEVGASAGVDSLKESMAVLWFDYDNDGDLDLLVGNNGDAYEKTPPETVEHILYRNLGDGTFDDVTAAAGIPSYAYVRGGPLNAYPLTGGFAAGDMNGDGYLDVYISIWSGPLGDFLLLNNGDGTFTDISSAAGIDMEGASWTPMLFDLNRDGLLDIRVASDFYPDRMFINNGGETPTFTDVAETCGLDQSWNEMGTAVADYDNDGDLDIYITNIQRPFGEEPLTEWNELHRNDSVGEVCAFTEVAQEAGVAKGDWGWGAVFLDYDHDGWLDLAEVNGWPAGFFDYSHDPSKLWRNDGNASTFTEVSDEGGFNAPGNSRSLTAFDFDRDGDLDLLVTNYSDDHDDPEADPRGATKLYRNDGGNSRNWVVVDPIIAGGGNSNAIGAEVYVDAGDLHMMRLITAGNSFVSQAPDEAHFGLGDATIIDEIRVRWPDGSESAVSDQPVNTVIKIWDTPTDDANPVVSDPPGDSIDARQRTNLECSQFFGWESIDIIYDGDTGGVQASDFTVTVDPADVTPPGIVAVVPSGNTATLEFDRRIPLRHWTIITHDASGFATRIGALPADVSGDRTSGPVDILDLIDFLNEVGPALEIWQTDIDRSGETNPADILKEIDLLNGAGCYDAWNGETLP